MIEDFKKIPLTERLRCIVDLVHNTNTVFDIACDHGYVGLELLKEEKAKKVVFSDIKEGPLNQAKNNFDKYCKNNMNYNYDFRLGDGFSVIKDNEHCDIAIISGIGYDVMVSILETIKNYDIDYLILCSHSKVQKFKEYLLDKKYDILEEKEIFDYKKIYTIQKIKVKK